MARSSSITSPTRSSLVAEHGDFYGETTDHLTAADIDPQLVVMRDGPRLMLHVVDRDGMPVLGAKVEDNDHNDGYTDRDGVLRRRGMSFNSTRFTVSAPGYASVDVRIDVGDDPRRRAEHRVVLQPAKPVGGIVVDDDGNSSAVRTSRSGR